MSSLPQQLQELAVLRQNGTISEEEYIASKAAILGKNPAPVQVANVTPVIQQQKVLQAPVSAVIMNQGTVPQQQFKYPQKKTFTERHGGDTFDCCEDPAVLIKTCFCPLCAFGYVWAYSEVPVGREPTFCEIWCKCCFAYICAECIPCQAGSISGALERKFSKNTSSTDCFGECCCYMWCFHCKVSQAWRAINEFEKSNMGMNGAPMQVEMKR